MSVIDDFTKLNGDQDFASKVFGWLTGDAAQTASAFLPEQLRDSIVSALSDGKITNALGGALKNVPLAGFKMKILEMFKGVGDEISKEWEKADQSANEYAKKIGLTSKQVQELRDSAIKFSNSAKIEIEDIGNGTKKTIEGIGAAFNKSISDLIKLQSSYSEAVGRSIRLTHEQKKDILAMSVIVGDDMATKLSSGLEHFGLSVSSAGELLTGMYNTATKTGVSLAEYSKNVTDNLALAQKYTFKDGVDGLTSMAEKATRMKLDMQMVASFADKVSDVSKATETAASLQVLGGTFSQFADPLSLLYGSMNDLEGLQDNLLGMFGNLGTFNREKGQVEVSAYNKQRIKAASEAAGLDYGKVMESIHHNAKRSEIENQMRGLTNIDERYKEAIINTATFKNGVAGFAGANGEFVSLAEASGKDLEKLAANSNTEAQNVAEIAVMLRGMTDIKEGEEKQKENQKAEKFQNAAQVVKGIYDEVAATRGILEEVVNLDIGYRINKTLLGPASGLGSDVMKFFGSVTHSKGGLITSGSPGREYLLNSAQYGEYVINKESTMKYLPLIEQINKGTLGVNAHFGGGFIGGVAGSMAKPAIDFGRNTGLGGLIGYMGLLSGLNPIYSLLGMGLLGGAKGMNPVTAISDNLNSLYDKKFDRVIETYRRDARSRYVNMDSHKTFTDSKGVQHIWHEDKQQWSSIGKDGRERLLKSDGRTFKELQKTVKEDNSKILSEYRNNVREQNRLQLEHNLKVEKVVNYGMTGIASIATGIGAYNSSRAKYKSSGEDIMDHGKAVGGTIGNVAVSSISTGLLMAIPGIGPAMAPILGPLIGETIGTTIGETLGSGNNARRGRMHQKISSGLSESSRNAFDSIMGNYSVSEQKKIASALSGDNNILEWEVGPQLFEKLARNGNSFIMKEYARGGLLEGPSHIGGGIPIEGENGEYMVNKYAAKDNIGLLDAINSGKIKSSEPMGKQMIVKKSSSGSGSYETAQSIEVKPIEIKFSGSIKLETNGQNFDISKELMTNPQFVNKLTDIITRQININDNGSFDKTNYKQKWAQI